MRLSRVGLAFSVAAWVACASTVQPAPVHISGTGCGTDLVGSGVVVQDGLVLTNAHVVAGAERLYVTAPGDEKVEASVVRFDAVRDLALLEADVAGEAVIAEADPGDAGTIYATNRSAELNPLGYEIRRHITATGGDIYRRGDHERQALDLAADIDPGDSGAGAFDGDGQLVGVVFASSRTLDSTAYAVSGAEITAFLNDDTLPTGASSECP